jgi:hypothetical protein
MATDPAEHNRPGLLMDEDDELCDIDGMSQDDTEPK